MKNITGVIHKRLLIPTAVMDFPFLKFYFVLQTSQSHKSESWHVGALVNRDRPIATSNKMSLIFKMGMKNFKINYKYLLFRLVGFLKGFCHGLKNKVAIIYDRLTRIGQKSKSIDLIGALAKFVTFVL